jgi:adenylate cyclase
MRPATKRRLKLFLNVVLIGMLIGVAYGGLTGLAFGLPPLPRGLMGAIDGAVITAPIAAIEIFLLPSRWGRPLQEAPFLVMFGTKWLLYAIVIVTVILGGPGARMLGLTGSSGPLRNPLVRLALLFSVGVTFAFLFVFELRQIVGPRNLRNIVLGRYHRPRVEERFFLFVDIAGSTSLAERLGPSAVHRFLAMVFRLASEPIDDHGGEIYQYVGDELVVTWTVPEARPEARPLGCFFSIVAALEAAAPEFDREFGVAPRLRAALHAGTVIIGEIGESKRDIVFHGDVMNTTARLEQATRDLDRRFLASVDAIARLEALGCYALEPIGFHTLRGRAAPVDVYAVEKKRSPLGADHDRLAF